MSPTMCFICSWSANINLNFHHTKNDNNLHYIVTEQWINSFGKYHCNSIWSIKKKKWVNSVHLAGVSCVTVVNFLSDSGHPTLNPPNQYFFQAALF